MKTFNGWGNETEKRNIVNQHTLHQQMVNVNSPHALLCHFEHLLSFPL